MRGVIFAFVGLVALAFGTPMAEAVSSGSNPIRPNRTEAGANPHYLEIAQGCGPGFHWVGRHRNRYGAWVPGHCARN